MATKTKAETLDAVANASGVSKADAERVLGSFFDYVTTTAKAGDAVAWSGFGKFSTSKRAARTGRNPQTGEAIHVPAGTRAKVTAGSKLKAAGKS